MDRDQTRVLTVQRNTILGLLLAMAVTAWALLLAWHGSGAEMDVGMASPTMGLRPPLFLAIWVTMMVAMMFPTAAPMVLTFHRVQAGRRERGGAFVSTWVFVAGYLLVWTLAGVAAYLAAVAAEAAAARAALSPETAARIGGTVLVAAGLYQLSPLKDLRLSKCRTPVGFVMTSWRDGTMGALRMGLLHGAYCLGCCWLLFAILFPLGLMNIAAMAVLTALVFAEKTLPWGRWAARGTAAVLIAYGALVIGYPPSAAHLPDRGRHGARRCRDADADGHAGTRRRRTVPVALSAGTVRATERYLRTAPQADSPAATH
jgi:predicted metal-binding membrane protein